MSLRRGFTRSTRTRQSRYYTLYQSNTQEQRDIFSSRSGGGQNTPCRWVFQPWKISEPIFFPTWGVYTYIPYFWEILLRWSQYDDAWPYKECIFQVHVGWSTIDRTVVQLSTAAVLLCIFCTRLAFDWRFFVPSNVRCIICCIWLHATRKYIAGIAPYS